MITSNKRGETRVSRLAVSLFKLTNGKKKVILSLSCAMFFQELEVLGRVIAFLINILINK